MELPLLKVPKRENGVGALVGGLPIFRHKRREQGESSGGKLPAVHVDVSFSQKHLVSSCSRKATFEAESWRAERGLWLLSLFFS